MIEIIEDLPENVAGFKATGNVTEVDYDNVVNPKVERVYKNFGKINYLLVLDTPLKNYSAGAWIKDAILGFVYFTEWRKIAIVSQGKGVKDFTNFFGKLIPGKTRGFLSDDVEAAKQWISQ